MNRLQQFALAMGAALIASCATSPAPEEGSQARRAAQTNTELGRQYIARGDYEVALDKLKRAVAYDRTYAPAHTVLAYLYETIGDNEMARKEYHEAVKYDPKDGSVNNNYGASLCAAKRWAEAEPYFERALKDPFYETPQLALSNAGLCALGAGDLDKADKYLRQSIEYDQNLPASLLALAKLNYQRDQYLTARAFLQRYEANASHTEESLELAYRVERELGDEKAAIEYRSLLMQNFPNSPASKALDK